MNKQLVFTSDEIRNLSFGLDRLMNDLKNHENQEFFYNHPILTLKKYDILIFDYFRNNNNSRLSFVNSLRRLINNNEEIFNNCLRCKLAILIIIYAMIAKSGLIFLPIFKSIDELIGNIKQLFAETSSEMESIIRDIEYVFGPLTPSGLAIAICRLLGECPPVV